MPFQIKPGSQPVRAEALCVSANRAAADAGAAVLREGGNAFDAAVTAGFVAAVVGPHNSGIGGYGATGIGFIAKSGRLVAVDANTAAPTAATPTMFPILPTRDPNGYKLRDKSHRAGPLSVGVPGVVAGLLTMLDIWGTVDRKRVLAPAIRHARQGVAITAGQAKTWRAIKAESEGRTLDVAAPTAKRVPMRGLADALEAIAEEGTAVFYGGRLGQAIADHIQKRGGILTREDMASYRAHVVEPVTVVVRGHTLATPPPSSGGLTALQMVALFDRLQAQGKTGEPGSAQALEVFLEIAKVVWEERLTRLGDPAAMSLPAQSLLLDAHLDALLGRVVHGLEHPGPGRVVAPDPLRGTVHLATADAAGNAVAWTQTHGGLFGSLVMVPGTEIVLGHGMCRFEPRPGWVNSIAPGKRPLHNMAPAIAVRDGVATHVVGAAGGRTIVNNSAAITIARLVQRLEPLRAMTAPRLHCETVEPATVESTAGPECLAALRERGHTLKEVNRDAGNAHLIAREGERWLGVAEPRSQGAAAVPARAEG